MCSLFYFAKSAFSFGFADYEATNMLTFGIFLFFMSLFLRRLLLLTLFRITRLLFTRAIAIVIVQ